MAVFSATSSLWAQEWSPKRIVGMKYPPLAAQARLEGVVNLRCVIDQEGRVESSKIESGSNPANTIQEVLGEAAKLNVVKWRFSKNAPESASGAPEVVVRYFFKLVGERCSNGRLEQEFVFEYPNSVFVTSGVPCLQP